MNNFVKEVLSIIAVMFLPSLEISLPVVLIFHPSKFVLFQVLFGEFISSIIESITFGESISI